MHRASLERTRTIRTWRAHNRLVHNGLPTSCPCDQLPGRFRKGRRVGGCGRPRCGLCKRHKLNDEAAPRNYRAALSYREWGSEYGFCIRMPRKPW
jgi:hypothetical protein